MRGYFRSMKYSKSIFFASLIIIAYLLPLLIMGKYSQIMVWDNLDSNLVGIKMLVESGKIFSNSNDLIPMIMNGLPRSSLGSEYNVIFLLFYFFKPFTAYVINQVLIHFLAFCGMYLLLKEHFIKDAKDELITVGAALAFSLVPFWPFGGLSVAGLPFALYAFLNIREKISSKIDWMIILFLPLYSSFVLSGIFYIVALGILWLIDLIKQRKINYNFIFALFLITSMYLLVEYRTIYSMFFNSNVISHRAEFNPQLVELNFIEAFTSGIDIFINGQPHSHSLHSPVIIYALLLVIIIAVLTKTRIDLILKKMLTTLLPNFQV